MSNPITPAPLVGSEPSSEAIEMMAEHLHEEHEHDRQWTWPGHADDDGYRGNGGYVTITPPDVQCRLREMARRVLTRSAQINKRLASAPSPDPVGDGGELERLSRSATRGTWYTVDAPWGDGTWIVAGNPDPHAGIMVCDCQDMNESRPPVGPGPADDAAFIAASVNYVRKLLRSGKLVPSTAEKPAAFAAAMGSGGWQDISTAPKDGSVVDLLNIYGRRLTDFYWDDAIRGGTWTDYRDRQEHWHNRRCVSANGVTHWIRPPSSPVGKVL